MMKKKFFYVLATLLFSFGTAFASPNVSVKGKQIPAVYKTDGGMKQRVEILVTNEGDPVSAEVKLGKDVQKVELKKGENKIFFEIPVQEKTSNLESAESMEENHQA